LKNGYYQNKSHVTSLHKVDGESVTIHSVLSLDHPDMENQGQGVHTYGDFGPAPEEVQIVAGGIENYNIEMSYMDGKWKVLGIVTNDRENVHFLGFHKDVTQFQWLSDVKLRKFLDDRDFFDSPSCPYKIQPENQGKLIWLSGPPGAGKSTTAQLLGRHDGYVYFEADAIASFLNPFVPTDVENPTIAAFRQKPLKGVSREFIHDMSLIKSEFQKMQQGKFDEVDFNKLKSFFGAIAKTIDGQRKRVGGNFSVAHAVNSQEIRESVRQIIPDVIFITLTLTRETQRKIIILESFLKIYQCPKTFGRIPEYFFF